jgi:hypothetical protein
MIIESLELRLRKDQDACVLAPNSELRTPNSQLRTPNSELRTPNSELQDLTESYGSYKLSLNQNSTLNLL